MTPDALPYLPSAYAWHRAAGIQPDDPELAYWREWNAAARARHAATKENHHA